MALYSSGIIHPSQLQEAVDRAFQKLDRKEVRLVRYSVGVDSTGETTIFFRILLTDYASEESRLGEVTERIAGILFDEIQPWEKWGVLPDFTFRSESEQKQHYDPAWV